MEQSQTKLLIPTLRRFYEWAEPVSWLLVMLAIALRGGGPYSLDRRLGREL